MLLFLAALSVLFAVAVGLRALAKSPVYQLFGGIVPRVQTTDSIVALTFDDGPTVAVRDTLLATLALRGVHATFFVVGSALAGAPELGNALHEAGHELGNHTYTHRRMVPVRQGTIAFEIERTDSLIRAAGHDGAIHFRPPYGYKLLGLPWYLARRDRLTITWDVEPDSYPDVAATAGGIVRHVMERVRPGSIILLHPWYASRATSLGAVGPLIDSLHARGYRVGTVAALMRARDMRDTGVQVRLP
ncbi:MAG: polysaccharide deacetylase family protein [Gemmatimonadaceae bacterium]